MASYNNQSQGQNQYDQGQGQYDQGQGQYDQGQGQYSQGQGQYSQGQGQYDQSQGQGQYDQGQYDQRQYDEGQNDQDYNVVGEFSDTYYIAPPRYLINDIDEQLFAMMDSSMRGEEYIDVISNLFSDLGEIREFKEKPRTAPYAVSFFSPNRPDVTIKYNGVEFSPSFPSENMMQVINIVSNINTDIHNQLMAYSQRYRREPIFNRVDVYYMDSEKSRIDAIAWKKQIVEGTPIAITFLRQRKTSSILREEYGYNYNSSKSSTGVDDQEIRKFNLGLNVKDKAGDFKGMDFIMTDSEILYGWGVFADVINFHMPKLEQYEMKARYDEDMDTYILIFTVSPFDSDLVKSPASSSQSSMEKAPILVQTHQMNPRWRSTATLRSISTGTDVPLPRVSNLYKQSILDKFKGPRPIHEKALRETQTVTFSPSMTSSDSPASTSTATPEIMRRAAEYYDPQINYPLTIYEIINIIGTRVEQLYDPKNYQPVVDTFYLDQYGKRIQITNPFEIARREFEQCRLEHLSVIRKTLKGDVEIKVNDLLPQCRR